MKKIWIMLALAAAAAVYPAVQAQTAGGAEVLLESARKKELLSGDLEGAIRQYKEILAKHARNRPVAATALVRMGQCYEKLGDAEARKAYERAVREYGDQAAVQTARARLAAMGGGEPDGGLVARQIWAANEGRGYYGEAISPDGRYGLYFYEDAIYLHELATGQTRQVSEPVGKGELLGDMMISPDGRQIVYVRRMPDWSTNLCFRNIDGSGARRLALNKGVRARLWSWSPDGRSLLASLSQMDGEKRVSSGVLLAVADGSTRVLPWNPTGGRFSPDGRHVVFVKAVQQLANRGADLMLASLDGGPERALVEGAGANREPVWTPAGDRVLFISDRREKAELWSIKVVNGRAGGPPELVREDAGTWSPVGMTRNGDYYYMSHSYTGDLLQVEVDPISGKAASPPVRLTSRNTSFAPAWSPDGEWLAYYREPGAADKQMYRSLVLRSARSGEERVVTPRNPRQTRPLLQWHPDGRAVLIDVRSALFRLDIETGEERELVKADDMEWRKSMAPDGRVVYYSPLVAGGNGWRILRRNLESGEEKQLCLLDADEARGVSVSPDGSWLAFLARFGDRLAVMTVPAGGGEPRELYRSGDLSLTPWGSYTLWGKDGRRVFFTAREGKTGHQDIFSVPAEGGPAQAAGAVRDLVGGISLHPDGRRMVYVDRKWRSELWVLKNLVKPDK